MTTRVGGAAGAAGPACVTVSDETAVTTTTTTTTRRYAHGSALPAPSVFSLNLSDVCAEIRAALGDVGVFGTVRAAMSLIPTPAGRGRTVDCSVAVRLGCGHEISVRTEGCRHKRDVAESTKRAVEDMVGEGGACGSCGACAFTPVAPSPSPSRSDDGSVAVTHLTDVPSDFVSSTPAALLSSD